MPFTELDHDRPKTAVCSRGPACFTTLKTSKDGILPPGTPTFEVVSVKDATGTRHKKIVCPACNVYYEQKRTKGR